MLHVTQPEGSRRVNCSFSVTSVEDDVEELSDDLLSCDSALAESRRGAAPSVEEAGAELLAGVAT